MIQMLLGISQIFTMLISLIAMLTAIGVSMRFQKSQKLSEKRENLKDTPVNITKDELEKMIEAIADAHIKRLLMPMKEVLEDEGNVQ